jgi:hypothetical protein
MTFLTMRAVGDRGHDTDDSDSPDRDGQDSAR